MKQLIKKIIYVKILILIFIAFGIDYSNATDVGGTISTNTNWTLAGSPYIVTSNIILSSGYTLTIESGVEVKVNGHYYIDIRGTLDAQGTSLNNIIFTSNSGTPAKSDWSYLRFNGAGSNASIINYVQVKYAGYSQSKGVRLYNSNVNLNNMLIEEHTGAGVYLEGASATTISNSTIRNNSTQGVRAAAGNTTLTNNTITNNGSYGIRNSTNVTYNFSGNTISDNGNNGIHSTNGSNTIENNTIENNTYGIYIGSQTNTLNNNTITTNSSYGIYLNNGTNTVTNNTVEDNLNTGIYINNGTNTVDDNVIDNNSGNGIHLVLGTNTIENSTITNNTNHGINNVGGTGDINTNTITGNGGDGINTDSSTASITSNIITGNTGYGLIGYNVDPFLTSSSNTISGNGNNTYYAHFFNTLLTTATVDFEIIIDDNSVLASGKTITLQPGAIIKIKGIRNIRIDGVLNGQGTVGENIYFTSIDDNSVGSALGTGTPGKSDWQYIRFYLAGSNSSTLNYVQVKYAGYAEAKGIRIHNSNASLNNMLIEENTGAGIYLEGTSAATITNSTIRNNSTQGIRMYGANTTFTNNTVTNNGTYGIRVSANVINNISNNTVSNNGNYGIYVSNGTNTIENNIIENNTYGINLAGGINTLNNNDITNNPSYGIYINSGTNTVTNSTVEDNLNSGIYINNGTNTLDNNIINTNTGNGIHLVLGTNTVSNNTITNNTNHGINNVGGTGNINTNIITGNGGDGINTDSSTASITSNTITGNTGYGLIGYNLDPFLTTSLNTISGNGDNTYQAHFFNTLLTTATVDFEIIIDDSSIQTAGTTINLLPGAIIKISGARYIRIDGILNAQGTSGENIYFTSIDDNSVGSVLGTGTPAKSDWQYIRFYGAGSSDSVLNYVQVKYAGYAQSKGIRIQNSNATLNNMLIEEHTGAGIYLEGTSATSITNSTIRNNSTQGIRMHGGNTTFTNNTVTSNGSYGIRVSINVTNNISNNTVSNNGNTGIFLSNGTNTVENNIIENNTYGINLGGGINTLNNNDITNNPNYGIYINNGTNIVTNSTIEDNLDTGIYVVTGTNTVNNNIINNNSGDGVNLVAGTNTVSNNTITNNTNHGIYNKGGSGDINTNTITGNGGEGINTDSSTASITSNTITGNTGYGLIGYNLDPFLTGSLNTISGNGDDTYYAHLFNTSLSSATMDFEIIIDDSSVQTAGTTINMLPGSIIKISGNPYIRIDGVLNAQGTAGENIYFTSINDNSVGSALGTGTPAKSDWQYIRFYGAGSSDSVLNYVQVKYTGVAQSKGIRIQNSNASLNNVLVEENTGVGIFLDGTTTTSITNSTIRNNTAQGIRVLGGNTTLTNNTITNNGSYGIRVSANVTNYIGNNTVDNNGNTGIYLSNGTNTVENNIISNNTNYGMQFVGTTYITYNLFFQNSTAPVYDYTPDGTNIVGSNPLFVPGFYELQSFSPAINTGNPALGNHPVSGDAYDIGAYEHIYTGFLSLSYGVDITGVSGRNLTYEWSFVSDPTGGSNPPIISNASGNINADGSINCYFQLQRLGAYQIKLVIKSGIIEIGSSINSFNVTN